MAVETHRSLSVAENVAEAAAKPRRFARNLRRYLGQKRSRLPFSSLTRRIIILNLFGLAILVSGILYLNQFRAGLIDAKVQSLLTQGEIIAGAIAASSTIDTDRVPVDMGNLLELGAGQSLDLTDDELSSLEFPINPEQAAPVLQQLIKPTGTRARIYNRDGVLTLDSDTLYSRGQILRYELPPPGDAELGFLADSWRRLRLWLWRRDLPLYRDIGGENGKAYPEVASALTGTPVPIVRVNEKGGLVVSVAVPIQRMRAVLGALLLSTKGGDIDQIVAAERWEIVRVSLFAIAVTVLLSVLLARTIAGPMHRLSEAAKQVRRSVKVRTEIPDFTHRSDEIGDLSGALRAMTASLYRRIDAIESFAADVSHELKNPLTSLRSAAETLPLARKKEERESLVEIIQHDVRRLDRLITDVSDASRLDAELAREDAEPVDMEELLTTIIPIFTDAHRTKKSDKPRIVLDIAPTRQGSKGYMVLGHDSRLGQVMTNLLDNAISFSPKRGRVMVHARRVRNEIEIAVEDEGPGIPPENLDKVFDRFYTDRPEDEDFGQNSGLGLHISRQIIIAHGGRIWAENRSPAPGSRRRARDGKPLGARLVIRLPAA